MSQTLLELVQDATDLIGVTRPTQVIGSTDLQVRQLLALIKIQGDELAAAGDWQALTSEHTFITVAAEEQTNTPVPADLDHFIPDTFFNRTTQRKLCGPLTPYEWQVMKAQPAAGMIYIAFRQRDGAFIMTPTPTAGDTVAYEFVSSYWAKTSADQPKATFTSDDDTTYLDDHLMKLGLIWRWKHAKGLDYGEDMRTYGLAVEQKLGEDGGSRAINIAGSRRGTEASRANVPESFPTS